jgi:hypothetical protein
LREVLVQNAGSQGGGVKTLRLLSPRQEAWYHWLNANAPTYLERFARALRTRDTVLHNKLRLERLELRDRFERSLKPLRRSA